MPLSWSTFISLVEMTLKICFNLIGNLNLYLAWVHYGHITYMNSVYFKTVFFCHSLILVDDFLKNHFPLCLVSNYCLKRFCASSGQIYFGCIIIRTSILYCYLPKFCFHNFLGVWMFFKTLSCKLVSQLCNYLGLPNQKAEVI